jgi:hypothetical protein
MQRIAILTVIAVAAALSSCDPAALGYVNKLPYPVTVVERGGKYLAPPTRLAPGEGSSGSIGQIPESIELRGSADHVVARYRTRDIPRVQSTGDTDCVVFTPAGPVRQLLPHAAFTQ